jgi:transcriptional regulator with XRE-family HTH domain
VEKPSIEQLKHRRTEIGKVLGQARYEANRSISECAALIGTSRLRYRKIEAGETDIYVTELEVLCRFLHLPLSKVLPQLSPAPPRGQGQVVLQTEQGQTLRVLVELVAKQKWTSAHCF